MLTLNSVRVVSCFEIMLRKLTRCAVRKDQMKIFRESGPELALVGGFKSVIGSVIVVVGI